MEQEIVFQQQDNPNNIRRISIEEYISLSELIVDTAEEQEQEKKKCNFWSESVWLDPSMQVEDGISYEDKSVIEVWPSLCPPGSSIQHQSSGTISSSSDLNSTSDSTTSDSSSSSLQVQAPLTQIQATNQVQVTTQDWQWEVWIYKSFPEIEKTLRCIMMKCPTMPYTKCSK